MAAFEKKMNEFTGKQIAEMGRQYSMSAIYSLQPLRSIHLQSHLMWEAEVNGDAKTVYFLLVIAFIIIIIAWVNYINLSTVKAIFRSKEVAIRKINGALRGHLINQFLTESFLINIMAVGVALILVFVLMPYFRTLTGRDLSMNSQELWLVMGAMVVAGPLVSGFYPAMVISSFKPVTIFRGNLSGGSGGATLRKVLVVVHFAASIAQIAARLLSNQLLFMRDQELGVDISQTLDDQRPGRGRFNIR